MPEGSICVKTTASSGFMHFNPDGSHADLPGLSIRPANYAPGQIPIEKSTTPSQWVEGKAPPVGERTGGVFIGKHGWEKPVYYGIDEIIRIEKYTHWQYVQLPPPPPAKEVEAYGYLEYMRMFFENSKSEGDAELAFDFYSQLATAEVLNKYFDTTYHTVTSVEWSDYQKDYTLDQWINWYKSQKGWDTLLFTPAALKELGIK